MLWVLSHLNCRNRDTQGSCTSCRSFSQSLTTGMISRSDIVVIITLKTALRQAWVATWFERTWHNTHFGWTWIDIKEHHLMNVYHSTGQLWQDSQNSALQRHCEKCRPEYLQRSHSWICNRRLCCNKHCCCKRLATFSKEEETKSRGASLSQQRPLALAVLLFHKRWYQQRQHWISKAPPLTFNTWILSSNGRLGLWILWKPSCTPCSHITKDTESGKLL